MDQKFIGLDVHKNTISVAIADTCLWEVRDYGKIVHTREQVQKLIKKLEGDGGKLVFCYEAGFSGYGLYRQIVTLGHECFVIAPSLVPCKPGERIKTDRRDAAKLARLLRAGELSPVWVPDDGHEAIRDLIRARTAAKKACTQARNQLSGFLLRQGHVYPEGKKRWGYNHKKWIHSLRFNCSEHQILIEDYLHTISRAEERCERLEKGIADAVPAWSLLPYVEAYQAVRGVSLLTAATIAAEAGDITRFPGARDFMGYVGLVPSEHSSGGKSRRGEITKAGNSHLRRVLVEAAWICKKPPKISKDVYERSVHLPTSVQEIAWNAQVRLYKRFIRMTDHGRKNSKIAAVAVARELAGFIWAIGNAVAAEQNG